MQRFAGHVEIDGIVKYSSVSGTYWASRASDGGQGSWNGYFEILPGETFDPEMIHKTAMLNLDIGKRGDINFLRADFPSNAIHFQGKGLIP